MGLLGHFLAFFFLIYIFHFLTLLYKDNLEGKDWYLSSLSSYNLQ